MLCGRSLMLWSLSRNCEQRNAGGQIRRRRTASAARVSSPGGCADITAGGPSAAPTLFDFQTVSLLKKGKASKIWMKTLFFKKMCHFQALWSHLLLLLQQQLCDDQAQREEGALLQGLLHPAQRGGGAVHRGRAESFRRSGSSTRSWTSATS